MPEMNMRQQWVAEWCRETFGDESLKDVPERVLRFVEEAVELAQATGVPLGSLDKLLDYVYSRPAGEPSQELAQCQVTLFAAAEAVGSDLGEVTATEMHRIRDPKVVERCRRRQPEKRAVLGGLPLPAVDFPANWPDEYPEDPELLGMMTDRLPDCIELGED